MPCFQIYCITQFKVIDWLTELKFNVQLDTKRVILEMLFPANLLASTVKIKNKSHKKKIRTIK